MSTKRSAGWYMRIIHRYLGFFLTGIMAVYALSGIAMIFRNTDAFKQKKEINKTLKADLAPEQLGKELRMRRFKVDKVEGDLYYFRDGIYNKASGEVQYTEKKLPILLDKMTHMHKATTDHPLFWMNIFFGVSLFFFVISTFWMFRPKTSTFRTGLYFTAGGIVLMVVMLWV